MNNITGAPARPIDRLMSARDALDKASAMTGDAADRLCGAVPKPPHSSAVKSDVPDGLFGTIAEIADHMNRTAENIVADMERIGRLT